MNFIYLLFLFIDFTYLFIFLFYLLLFFSLSSLFRFLLHLPSPTHFFSLLPYSSLAATFDFFLNFFSLPLFSLFPKTPFGPPPHFSFSPHFPRLFPYYIFPSSLLSNAASLLQLVDGRALPIFPSSLLSPPCSLHSLSHDPHPT